MPFHIYGAERTRRAQVFTGSAADAFFLVYDRKLRRIRVVRVFCHHQDRLGRAMAGTVAASDTVPVDDAIFLNQYGMSDLDGRFVRFRDWTDRSGRANFRTFDAFGTTVSSLVRYFWLHKCLKVPRRTQHMVRTNRYTKLARGAMLGEIGSAQRARRSDRGCPVRFLLSSMMASPPSTFLSGSCTFSWAFSAAEVASNADTVKNLRRSGLSTAGWAVCISALFVFLRVYRMAPCRHLSIQSMQATQRL